MIKWLSKVLYKKYGFHFHMWEHKEYQHYRYSWVEIKTRKCLVCGKVQTYHQQLDHKWVDGCSLHVNGKIIIP